MTADGGVVKARLLLDTSNFRPSFERAVKELTNSTNGLNNISRNVQRSMDNVNKSFSYGATDARTLSRSLREAEASFGGLNSQLSKVNYNANSARTGLQRTINEIQSSFGGRGVSDVYFYDARKYESALKNMENNTSASTSRMRNLFDGMTRSITFNGLTSKWDAAVNRMTQTASAGASRIKSDFTSIGASDYISAFFGSMIGGQVWEKGMGKAQTQGILQNMPVSQAEKDKFYSEYQRYTIASSTSDSDINKAFQYIMTSGLKPSEVYRGLSTVNAAAFNADPVQMYRDRMAWGSYVQGGYDQAKGMLRDEGLTDQMEAILQAAKTPEERLTALEKVNTMRYKTDLSTATTGSMANYNKVMMAYDTVMRGLVDGLNRLLDMIAPVADWFNRLDPAMQSTIGQMIFFGGVIATGVAAFKILTSILSPLGSGLKFIGENLLGLGKNAKDAGVGLDDIGKKSRGAGGGIDTFGNKVKSCSPCAGGSGGSGGSGAGGGRTSTAGSILAEAMMIPLLGGAISSLRPIYEGKWGDVPSNFQSGFFFGQITPEEAAKRNQEINQDAYNKSEWMKGAARNTLNFLTNPFGVDLSKIGMGAASATTPSLGNGLEPKDFIPTDQQSINIGKGIQWPSVEDILGLIAPTIPGFNWNIPGVGDLLGIISPNISWLNWFIPGVGDVLNIMGVRIPGVNWSIPGWGSVLDSMSGKISWLHWSIPSAGEILNAIVNRMSGGVTGGLVLGPPRGPAGSSSTGSFMSQVAGGFKYIGYAGSRQGINDTLSSMSGNCLDGSLAQMTVAESWGVPARLVATTWQGNPHVFTQMRVNGQWVDRDIANHALTGSWSRPPAGPGISSGGNHIHVHVTVPINAPVYDTKKLTKEIEDGIYDVLDDVADAYAKHF